MENKNFTLIKKIAKYGQQSTIVIPKLIEESLKPGAIVQINIEVLENLKEKALYISLYTGWYELI